MKQEIKNISITDLVLWTENPRDPIKPSASDQDIADHAFSNGKDNWKLKSLAEQMGDFFDHSELPTVVYHGDKPIVYDGNRRVLLGKLYYGLIRVEKEFSLPAYPELLPCNVCDKETALANVLRKHSGVGSWKPLERDIFLHKYMNEPKSAFLRFEEETSSITKFPELNVGFVKKEFLTKKGFEKLGFREDGDRFESKHDTEEVKSIFRDMAKKVKNKEMSTRVSRNNFFEALSPDVREMIDANKSENKFRPVSFPKNKNSTNALPPKPANPSLTPRKKTKEVFFGSKLYLPPGPVNNIYRDITDLNNYYVSKKTSLTEGFPNIIRMSLRLICESAAKERGYSGILSYFEANFAKAKGNLSQDQKTTLSTHNVTGKSITQLLHTGAHTYSSSANYQQTEALSIIIGEVLKLTHVKE